MNTVFFHLINCDLVKPEYHFGLNYLQVPVKSPRPPLSSDFQKHFKYRACALNFESNEGFCIKV